jgi:exodeoxyribonuclease-5
MPLTIEQERAANSIMDWLAETNKTPFLELGDSWMFVLQGYAGTGKTHLMGELIQRLQVKFHCVAPTGKAASVLMGKLNGIEVITMHRLLYQPADSDVFQLRLMIEKYKSNPTEELGKQIEEEKAKLKSKGPGFSSKAESSVTPGELVIVDEASMVDTRLRDDLRATGCRALFVGDPGQLPPVGSSSWFIDHEPDAMLEEIQRQALDNPIIRLSMEIRSGFVKPRDWRRREGCGIFTKDEIPYEEWLKSDQVITGSNSSRHKVNRYFRKQLGYSEAGPLPIAGEKLICLKNEYKREPQFINGTQFTSRGNCVQTPDDKECAWLDIHYEGIHLDGVQFYPYHCLSTYDDKLVDLPREFRKGLMELDFAYCITVHKSQGSEWDHVIIADDQMKKSDVKFRRQWLYTAVTRAKKTLRIIQ